MNNKVWKITGAGLVALAALGGGAWALGWLNQDDADLAEFKSMLADGPPTKERGEAMKQVIDKKLEGMTDDQKGEFFRKTMMPMFVSMMAKRFSDEYDKLMAMSPEEQTRELDRRIDEMQRNMRNMPKPPGPPPGGAGGPPGGPPSPEQVNEFRAKMLDMITPEQRAKMENGMKMMQQRMKARGIEAPPGPGGGFF